MAVRTEDIACREVIAAKQPHSFNGYFAHAGSEVVKIDLLCLLAR